jgi:hypothetical protein
VTDPSLEEVVFDAPFHEVIVKARPGHPFKLGDRSLVISLKRGKIRDLEEELVRKGFGVVALIPLRSCVVGLLFFWLACTYLDSRGGFDSRNKRGSIIVGKLSQNAWKEKTYEGLFLVAQLDLVDFSKVLFDETKLESMASRSWRIVQATTNLLVCGSAAKVSL